MSGNDLSLMTILWTCAAIVVGVFAVMIHSIVNFRNSPGGFAVSMRSTTREVLWALIPIMIVIGTAAPAVKNLVNGAETYGPHVAEGENVSQSFLTVKLR